jgi:F0F1-type ATP synthase assembly protein I
MAYRFDTHRYQSVAQKTQPEQMVTTATAIDPNEVLASAEPVWLEPTAPIELEPTATPASLSKAEQKELRSQLKAQLKTQLTPEKKAAIKKQLKADKAAGMDHDLKLAAVFGAVGIVGILLGAAADVFLIIGGIALLIGVIFFIKWLVRQ